MRESRSSGSVEGVRSNRDPYSDFLFFSFSFGCGNLFGIVGLCKSLQAGKVRLPQLRKYELAI
jgi:hypothetical protein